MTEITRPALMTVEEFREWSRLGRTKIYELIGSGEVSAIKIGRRTLIPVASAQNWLASQPGYR